MLLGEDRANVTGPVLGGVVLCIVVVVLVVAVARTPIGRDRGRATVSREEESSEEIPMQLMRENSLRRKRVSKRKRHIRERVEERMRNEPPLDVEGCEYSFVEDYGTAYGHCSLLR